MSSVLIVEQREQAGSDSYNRFEYQVHWIVCHIIGKLQEDAECIVFCEFHDDMAEFSPNNQQYQFFQIKTKEDSSDWTIAEMSKREKKKSGSYKKSFLGFIFYNYLTFGAECSHCHFVSNNDFDKDLRFEKLANNDNDIKVGEQVVTSYVSDRFVQGLFIGYISEINVDSNNLTRSGYITPAVDFSKIQEVLVLTKTKEDMTNGADDESASDTAKGE